MGPEEIVACELYQPIVQPQPLQGHRVSPERAGKCWCCHGTGECCRVLGLRPGTPQQSMRALRQERLEQEAMVAIHGPAEVHCD